MFCKSNTNYTRKWIGSFKFINIINETYKIILLFGLTNLKISIVKFYQIKLKNNNLNDILKIKYNDYKIAMRKTICLQSVKL